MRPRLTNYVFSALLIAAFVEVGLAAPVDLKLLPLVPPGAQLVAGFVNTHNKAGGPLMMTTANNVLDLDDWRSLAGVDPKTSFSEVIEVTFAPSGKKLNEHLLLAAGKFNQDRIFRAAELNVAQRIKYLAETVLIIEPFSREKREMRDIRWLAILDDRIAVFGTPWLVQQALSRFENRAIPDPILMGRLALFRRDVSSWNVLSSIPTPGQSVFLRSRSTFSALFEGTDLMMVGVRFDSKVRVDFVLHAPMEEGSVDLKIKAAQISRVFTMKEGGDNARSRKLKDVQVEENRLRASIVLSNDEFYLWKSGQIRLDSASLDLARGTLKAQTR